MAQSNQNDILPVGKDSFKQADQSLRDKMLKSIIRDENDDRHRERWI